MSHFTRVRTKVKNREQLIQALENLGYTVEERAEVRGWRGRTERADVVVRLEGKYDIGFKRANRQQAFEVVADWFGVSLEQDAFTNAVQQEYALVGAEVQARKAGWSNLKRHRQEDGTVVLRGRRVAGLGVKL